MAMMTGDRPVVISVVGSCSSTSHQTNYTVKVPYSSMAHTIQMITKQGGKITNVVVGTMMPSVLPSTAPSTALTATIEPIEESKKGFKSKKK